jgi:FMN phosphatase YigB (HAD superfamily)
MTEAADGPQGSAASQRAFASFAAWLIDLDGTLYYATPVRLAMAAELLATGCRAVKPLRRFRTEHERLRRELTEPTFDPYVLQLQRTAHALGLSTAQLASLVEAWMIRRPSRWLRLFRRRSLLKKIEVFHQAGGKTALVSDYPASEKLRALGARKLFDVVVANGEPGGPDRLKPWPDGLLAAAARLEVAPGSCLVLGDRPDADGGAAAAAGMHFRLVR